MLVLALRGIMMYLSLRIHYTKINLEYKCIQYHMRNIIILILMQLRIAIINYSC